MATSLVFRHSRYATHVVQVLTPLLEAARARLHADDSGSLRGGVRGVRGSSDSELVNVDLASSVNGGATSAPSVPQCDTLGFPIAESSLQVVHREAYSGVVCSGLLWFATCSKLGSHFSWSIHAPMQAYREYMTSSSGSESQSAASKVW